LIGGILRLGRASTVWFALLAVLGPLPADGLENSELQPAGQRVVNQSAPPADRSDALEEIVVIAERRGLIGTATTASEGIVVNEELALTPAYRPGQLLETVPGLVVTSHSGEGKANQYLLRAALT
jgi:hypothetical protein